MGQVLTCDGLKALPYFLFQVAILRLICLFLCQTNVHHADELLLFGEVHHNIAERLEHSHRHVVVHGPHQMVVSARLLVHYRIRDVLDRQQYHALALPFELDLLDL